MGELGTCYAGPWIGFNALPQHGKTEALRQLLVYDRGTARERRLSSDPAVAFPAVGGFAGESARVLRLALWCGERWPKPSAYPVAATVGSVLHS